MVGLEEIDKGAEGGVGDVDLETKDVVSWKWVVW
jgi:hypothetical protein